MEEIINTDIENNYNIKISFLSEEGDLSLNSDYNSFLQNICNFLKISSNQLNLYSFSYMDEDGDSILITTEENYKIFLNKKSEDEAKEDILQKLYYRILMTKIELGTPKRKFTFILDSDDDRYYIASPQSPKINIKEREKEPVYYNFNKSELLNESYSSTYKKGPCEAVDYNIFYYAELCTAKDIALFNQNNQMIEKNFEF